MDGELFVGGGFTVAAAQVSVSWARWECVPRAADFDGDGFVSGIDFDLYVAAFEAGDGSADFDSDGFVTGIDFDLFVLAFEAGC